MLFRSSTRVSIAVVNRFFIGYALLSFHPKIRAACTCAKRGQNGWDKDQCFRTALLLLNWVRDCVRFCCGYRGSSKNDSIPNYCHPSAVGVADIVGGCSVAFYIADGFRTAISANCCKTIPNLVIIGVVGVIGLPVYTLEVQCPPALCDCFGQVVCIGTGQVRIPPGDRDRTGFTDRKSVV